MLRYILPPKLKNMTSQYKVICGCDCCIYIKIIHSSLLSWRERFIKTLKYKICNAKNVRSGEMAGRLFGINKILLYHMEIISFRNHLKLGWQKKFISIIKLFIAALEMCFALLCTTYTGRSSKSIIRSALFKC